MLPTCRRAARGSRPPRARGWRHAALASGLVLGLALAPLQAIANDRAPTAEQLTERDRGVGALWDSLVENAAGLRIRFEENVVSTGRFHGAQLGWFRSSLSLEGGVPIGKSFGIAISPEFAWERLTVEGDNDFVVSRTGRDSRLDDFYDSSLRIGARYEFDETWSTEFVTGFSARHEAGAHWGDAAQSGGSVAVNYRRGKWLRLRLGIGLGADLSDGDLRVSPVYRIQLKPNPAWTFESSGLGGAIEWQATRKTSFSIAGKRDGTQYRLDKRGTTPTGSGDATLQRRQGRIDFEVRHRLRKKLRFRVGLGLVLDEQLTVIDEDGIEVDDRNNKDPSVTVRLGVEWRL